MFILTGLCHGWYEQSNRGKDPNAEDRGRAEAVQRFTITDEA